MVTARSNKTDPQTDPALKEQWPEPTLCLMGEHLAVLRSEDFVRPWPVLPPQPDERLLAEIRKRYGIPPGSDPVHADAVEALAIRDMLGRRWGSLPRIDSQLAALGLHPAPEERWAFRVALANVLRQMGGPQRDGTPFRLHGCKRWQYLPQPRLVHKVAGDVVLEAKRRLRRERMELTGGGSRRERATDPDLLDRLVDRSQERRRAARMLLDEIAASVPLTKTQRATQRKPQAATPSQLQDLREALREARKAERPRSIQEK
jgi:hypothetical protein